MNRAVQVSLLAFFFTMVGAVGVSAAQRMIHDCLKLEVQVYNYAEIPSTVLIQAELQASKVFMKGGIELVWHKCMTSGFATQTDVACSTQPGPSTPILRLLDRIGAVRDVTNEGALGFTVGHLASVSYAQALEISSAYGVDSSLVLGDSIAHELGHVLMPGRPHPIAGIMSAGWDEGSFLLMSKGSLFFFPEEKQVMRRALAAQAGNKGDELPLFNSGPILFPPEPPGSKSPHEAGRSPKPGR